MMKQKRQFTAIINREENGYVSLCPELDIASQGNTVEEARNNLVGALKLLFEVANAAEIESRLHGEVFEVPYSPFELARPQWNSAITFSRKADGIALSDHLSLQGLE
jgi:predicted RNase H-like HicB family nuclease